MGTRILLIEDEKNILELVRYNLQNEGYRVLMARDGEEGLKLAERERPDLILLDLLLPKLDGWEVCRRLKQHPATRGVPIMMLTAKAGEADKVAGLELGAEDYLTKPFSPRELVARVRVILRRRQGAEETVRSHCGQLEMDWERHVVSLQGKSMRLTPKEFELLKTLMQAHGRVLSREFLLDRVWGYTHAMDLETRTVDFHVSQLRQKLKGEARRLLTIPGSGYRFVMDEELVRT